VRAALAAAALSVACPPGFAGTWTKLAHNAPAGVNGMLLLSDGTVMAARNNGGTIGKDWYRLTPDSSGSYVNGTWSTLAPMHDTRLYYATQMLKDGRVFVAGGEYGTGGPHSEVYDPLTDSWTQTDPPAAIWNTATDNFIDSMADILPDGKVLIMPVDPHTFGIPLLYDPVSNTWSNAGKLKVGGSQTEATWVKLKDDTILTVDPFGTHSERYVPPTNEWINDSTVPVSLYDPFGGEIGAALLLEDGRAFFIGSTGNTALYTPTGTTAPGVWVAGPVIPNDGGQPDAPAAMMVTGNILVAASHKPVAGNVYPSPTFFYEYDPVANAFTQVSAPNGTSSDPISAFAAAMLDLPDGTVLYSHFGSDVYVYTPDGAPLASGKPAITSITPNGDGSFHLVGTGLNGISQGASYGDDLQMNSNYPIVRLRSGADVYYARTFNWSSTSVQTGALPVSTEFRVPVSVPGGTYDLEVVANGFASDAVPFTQPNSGTWTALASGLPGVFGTPLLNGTGTQVAGQPAEVDLIFAAPSAPATLFVSTSSTPVPFKGGTLVPVPMLLTLPFTTSPVGTIALPFTWPDGLPSGFSLYYQYAVKDIFGAQGLSLSTALRSTAP